MPPSNTSGSQCIRFSATWCQNRPRRDMSATHESKTAKLSGQRIDRSTCVVDWKYMHFSHRGRTTVLANSSPLPLKLLITQVLVLSVSEIEGNWSTHESPNREISFGFVSCSCRACVRAGEAKLCGRVPVTGECLSTLGPANLTFPTPAVVSPFACLLLFVMILMKRLRSYCYTPWFWGNPSNLLLYAIVLMK